MKKYLVFALVLGMCAFLPNVANAGEVIGTGGVDQFTFGNLGINTAVPGRALVVKADADNGKVISVVSSTGAAEVYSVSSLAHGGKFNMANSSNVAKIQLNTAGTSFIVGSNLGVGTKTPAKQLDVAGTARCEILEITGGADLSEMFRVTAAPGAGTAMVEPGMVVSIDTVKPGELIVSSRAYDRTVVGIVSGAGGLKTGMMMGQITTLADGDHPVALTGRVYCKVDTSQGAIAPGDLLTTSAVPGHAMKVSDYTLAQGAIIGKAMTPLAQGEQGLVLVLVSLQ